MKKWLRNLLFVVLFLVLLIFGGLINKSIQCKIVIYKFIDQLKTEDASDLTLTIYYMNPSVLTEMPGTVDTLIANCEHEIANTEKRNTRGRFSCAFETQGDGSLVRKIQHDRTVPLCSPNSCRNGNDDLW